MELQQSGALRHIRVELHCIVVVVGNDSVGERRHDEQRKETEITQEVDGVNEQRLRFVVNSVNNVAFLCGVVTLRRVLRTGVRAFGQGQLLFVLVQLVLHVQRVLFALAKLHFFLFALHCLLSEKLLAVLRRQVLIVVSVLLLSSVIFF